MRDLIIIGGGPAGCRAAGIAAKAGLKTALFEGRHVGGVCLNEGCIPTKSLLYSAKIYDYMNGGGARYGVSCVSPILDYAAAVQHKDDVVKKLGAGMRAELKKSGVELISEDAVISSRVNGGFEVRTDVTVYIAAKLLICTGSQPMLPPIKNIERAMTNREILALTEAPESLAIIGGGVIGLEMASLFNSAGSRVTVYEMAEKIAGYFDREISDMLQKIYERKGVTFQLKTTVNDITELDAENVLVSIGRKPSIEGLGLENIGVLTERGAVVTDEFMKTSLPGVFAAGDVNGKSMLAHTAYREAEVAAANILGGREIMDYGAIPSIIYTNPEAAGIGHTLDSAREKGINAAEIKLPMQYSGRFMAENEGDGICKLVLDGNRLIGAHMLGNPCSEIISTIAALMHREITVEQIKNIVFPHPTVAEIIKEVAFHA